jgi:hypothetical protein
MVAQLQRAHFTQAFEAHHDRFGTGIFRGNALQRLLAFRFIERIDHFLADIDAKQRRHADVHMSGHHQRPVVTQKQGAQERRDMLPVAVRIRQDADLVITQTRQIGGGGLDADRDTDVVHLLGLQDLAGVRFPGIQDLAP